MELFLLYLWLKVDIIISLLTTVGLASTVIFVIVLFWANLTESWESEYATACRFKTKGWKRWVWLPITCFVLAAGIPSRTDIAVLAGGSYALDVAKSPEASKLMTVIRSKANEILDKQIKTLTPPVAASTPST